MTRLGFTSYTSNGIFQLLLLVLLGVILPQNHLKNLKIISENNKIVRTFINDYKVSKLKKELLKAIKWHPSTSSANLAKAGHSDNK